MNEYDVRINKLLSELYNREKSEDEIYAIVIESQDKEFVKRCIEKRKEFRFDDTLIHTLISGIDDIEYTKECIKRAKELGIDSYTMTKLILKTKDIDYIKNCIENGFELGIIGFHICHLITTINDQEYTKAIIENKIDGFRFESLSSIDRGRLIQSINDKEYLKNCIRRKDELGFDSCELGELILSTRDKRYMKECIKDHDKYNLESKYIYHILSYIDDIELIKSAVEDRKELGIKDEDLFCLIIRTYDEVFIEKCVSNFKKMGIDKYYLVDMLKQCSDEFIQKAIDNEVEEVKGDIKILDKLELLQFIEKQEVAIEIIKEKTKSKEDEFKHKKIKLPNDMTVGIEIEADEGRSYLAKDLDFALPENWKSKFDGSLKDGVEIVSPILKMENTEKEKEIAQVCNYMKLFDEKITQSCAGHIHIGANYLKSDIAWKNLIEIWSNTERILYIISNQEGEKIRKEIQLYAAPISKKIENRLNRLSDRVNIVQFLKDTQSKIYSSINFQNVGDYSKNTIEIRTPNGTLNPEIWIENINLFGGIVKAAEELSIIQTKKEPLTIIEQEKIRCYELLKREEVDERLKLRSITNISS